VTVNSRHTGWPGRKISSATVIAPRAPLGADHCTVPPISPRPACSIAAAARAISSGCM
jgi:V8-like Glu-specific endopeptidase